MWRVDGCCHRQLSSDQQWSSYLHPLEHQERILVSASGKSLCKVSSDSNPVQIRIVHVMGLRYPFLVVQGNWSGETAKTEVTCHLCKWSVQEIYKHNFFGRIFGSYEALEGGHARDALVNMTGGVGEDISVADYTESEEKRKKLFQILNSAIEDRALISASISVKKNWYTVKL